jgi:Holliday junction resolvase RusA-like endonuclease
MAMPRTGQPTSLWIPGCPRTKGSLRAIPRSGGGVYMTEGVAGSSAWRKRMADVARAGGRRHGRQVPIEVSGVFVMPRRRTARDDAAAPLAARDGDIDKLARNALDAFQDAGVYEEDVQVCHLDLWKVYAPAAGMPHGAMLTVVELEDSWTWV